MDLMDSTELDGSNRPNGVKRLKDLMDFKDSMELDGT